MIDVRPARLEEKAALQNMMQLYIHDFTEHWAGLSERELGRNAAFAHLGADGRFPDYPLDAYWVEGGRVPLLIEADGRLAGFALLNRHAHSGLPVDRSMAEFFVARGHRRGGVGTKAAQAIFTAYPGQWEAAVARRNAGALAFWRNAIATCADANALEETDVKNEAWDGAILRFRIGA